MRWIILGSRPIPLLMGHVWFNCNRVFIGFEFIFSNPRRVRDGFMYFYFRLVSIIFKKYFIIILFYILI